MQTLAGKIALIIGCGKGIGHAIAVALHNAGAHVIAVARNKENLDQLAQQVQTNITCVALDLTTEKDQEALLHHLQQNGFPHIVINNLHIPVDKKRVINISKEYFSKDFTINIDPLLVIMEQALQFQRQEKFGRWIGISSMSIHSGVPGQGMYSAQKASMEALFTNLATEEGKHGITSNIVAPGFIDTPGVRERLSQPVIDLLSNGNVIRRAGRPEEVAAAVAFLASPGAAYITGITLPVAGGVQLAWAFM